MPICILCMFYSIFFASITTYVVCVHLRLKALFRPALLHERMQPILSCKPLCNVWVSDEPSNSLICYSNWTSWILFYVSLFKQHTATNVAPCIVLTQDKTQLELAVYLFTQKTTHPINNVTKSLFWIKLPALSFEHTDQANPGESHSRILIWAVRATSFIRHAEEGEDTDLRRI